MELINPNEIGAKISTLFAEANEKIICISPYLKISEWKKIKTSLEKAISKGVKVTFYYRESTEAELIYLKRIGAEYYQIDGLHTKLYFSEENVVVSSMNLYEYSDLHSIDLAIQYSEKLEYDKLFNYFLKYIVTEVSNANPGANIKIIGEDDKLTRLKLQLDSKYNFRKVTKASNYLFISPIPYFDVMLLLTSLTLKFSIRDPEENDILRLEKLVEEILGPSAIISFPSEEYKYLTWDIELKTSSVDEIFGHIDNVLKIEY